MRAPRAPGVSLLSHIADRESPAPPYRWPASCQPPAASHPARAPGAPGLSLDPVSTPEFQSSVRSLVASASGSRSQSALLQVQVHGPPAPPCRWILLPRARTWRLPPPSICLLISVCSFTAPRVVPQYSALEMFICRDPDVFPVSQADSVDVPAGLLPIQLNSGDRLKKVSPTPPPS